jgi:hypothetical protein
VFQLLVTACVVPNSPVLSPVMISAIRSSETSALTRATWRNIPKDIILFSEEIRSVRRLLVTASVVLSSPILVNLMKEALSSTDRRFLQEQHGVTSQRTPFFTGIMASNPPDIVMCLRFSTCLLSRVGSDLAAG